MTERIDRTVPIVPFLVAKTETDYGVQFWVNPSSGGNRPMAVALRKDGFDDLAALIHTPLREADRMPPTVCRISGQMVDQLFVSASFDNLDWSVVDMSGIWFMTGGDAENLAWNQVVEAYLAGLDRPTEGNHVMTDTTDDGNEIPDRPMPIRRNFSALSDTGLLWLINTTVFHPRGYAIALIYPKYDGEDAPEPIGWWIIGDGSEPWYFDPSDPGLQQRFEWAKEFLTGDQGVHPEQPRPPSTEFEFDE